MIALTDHLMSTAPTIDATFRAALLGPNVRPVDDYALIADVRARHGFARLPADLLTPPSANHKLNGAAVKSYGLTLSHFRSVLPAADGHKRLSVNACPSAGHCTRVCVLNNGNGRYDSVKRAWLWRTDLLTRHPESFARVLAFELRRAVDKYGEILFRPNVNSDVAWEHVLPSLMNGALPGVTSYGYSKLPDTLAGNGWLGSSYRVAYSWNERSNADDVAAFIARGGAVAIVTARRKGDPIVTGTPFGTDAGNVNIVDADKTDEWMLTGGAVIGDLSAKGKARELIGRSRFVVAVPVRLGVTA